jgi:hypothetical protein
VTALWLEDVRECTHAELTVFVVAELQHQLVTNFCMLQNPKAGLRGTLSETTVRHRGCYHMESWSFVVFGLCKKREDLGGLDEATSPVMDE